MTSSSYCATARCTTDRITAFRPGQSPPAVRTPMRIVLCLLVAVGTGEPVRLFHVPQAGDDCPGTAQRGGRRSRCEGRMPTGALSSPEGIVKKVPLTSVGHFASPHPRALHPDSRRHTKG